MNKDLSAFGREWVDFDYEELLPPAVTSDPALRQFVGSPDSVLESLSVNRIDDHAGFALFACGAIDSGVVIGVLTGDIVDSAAAGRGLPRSGQVLSDAGPSETVIDASFRGNQIHFLQHLPSSRSVLAFDFDRPIDRRSIATENLIGLEVECVGGLRLSYFRTVRRIADGEILGCAYTDECGEIDMAGFYFFSTKGEPVAIAAPCNRAKVLEELDDRPGFRSESEI